MTGDLVWEYRRDRPDDLGDYMIGTLIETNRNVAIHGELIIDTTMDDHIVALDAETGDVVWDTEILDYTVNPANQTSGPIVAGGKVYSGRSCDPRGGPEGCVITAHDAATGEELWRRRLIPAPGEPGDQTWGAVPYEERRHVGSWMVPTVDPELNPPTCPVPSPVDAEPYSQVPLNTLPLVHPHLPAGDGRRAQAPLVRDDGRLQGVVQSPPCLGGWGSGATIRSRLGDGLDRLAFAPGAGVMTPDGLKLMYEKEFRSQLNRSDVPSYRTDRSRRETPPSPAPRGRAPGPPLPRPCRRSTS